MHYLDRLRGVCNGGGPSCDTYGMRTCYIEREKDKDREKKGDRCTRQTRRLHGVPWLLVTTVRWFHSDIIRTQPAFAGQAHILEDSTRFRLVWKRPFSCKAILYALWSVRGHLRVHQFEGAPVILHVWHESINRLRTPHARVSCDRFNRALIELRQRCSAHMIMP
jgi:hypothetical protein